LTRLHFLPHVVLSTIPNINGSSILAAFSVFSTFNPTTAVVLCYDALFY